MYVYGYYFFDQGLYSGRFIGDIVAIVLWVLFAERLTPYWTDIWTIYQKYNIAWADGSWPDGVDLTLDDKRRGS